MYFYTKCRNTKACVCHVIGYEESCKQGSNNEQYLLLLDPSVPTHVLLHALQHPTTGKWQRFIKRKMTKMKACQYQIVYIDSNLLVPFSRGYEDAKILSSEKS